MSEFAQFLPPSTDASSGGAGFDAFRPPVKKKEPPGVIDRLGAAAVGLWDAAKKTAAPTPTPAPAPVGYDLTPPPGMDPNQQLFDLSRIEIAQANGKPVDNLLREMTNRGWKLNAPVKTAAPAPSSPPSFLTKIPYSGIEGAPTGEESPMPFREVAATVGQPFVKQTYTGVGSFLKGGGALTKGITDIGEYIGKPMGIPRSEVFDKAANMWLDKGEELHRIAQEKGADFVDKMVGSAVGGGVPGVAEFMLNVPYYSFKGAIDAAKAGNSQPWGALVGGAKRYALGKTLHATGTLTKPLAIPAMGGVMGVQTAAEGGTPEETAEAVGTGMIFGAIGAPGRFGARDVTREAGATIREGIDRLIRSKKPMTVETPSVTTPAPPAPPLDAPITKEAIPIPPPAPETPVAPPAAPGTPIENGFYVGARQGERYRVSETQGGVVLEKRSEMGTPSTFYVGPNGEFVDANHINFLQGGTEGKIWLPKTSESKTEATNLLIEIGKLELGRPERKALQKKLKDLVEKDKEPLPGVDSAAPRTPEFKPAAETGPEPTFALSKVSIGQEGEGKYIESVKNMVSKESIGPDVGKIPLNNEESKLFDISKKWDKLGNKTKARELQAEIVRMVAKRTGNENAWDISGTPKSEPAPEAAPGPPIPELPPPLAPAVPPGKVISLKDEAQIRRVIEKIRAGETGESIPGPEPPLAPAIAEKRAEERPVRSAFRGDQVPDLPTVDSDIAAARSNIADIEGELAKDGESDTMSRMAMQDRLNAWKSSLAILTERRQEILAGKPPRPVEIKPPEPIKEKTPQEISFEAARAAREPLPRTGEVVPPEPPLVNLPKKKAPKAKAPKEKKSKGPLLDYLGNRKLAISKEEFKQFRTIEQGLWRYFTTNSKKGVVWDKALTEMKDLGIIQGDMDLGTFMERIQEAQKARKEGRILESDAAIEEEGLRAEEKAARETVQENEIAPGDSFRINGEKFKAIKYDEDGRLVIKDGIEQRLSPGDDIRVDGGKEGIIPGEIPKATEETASVGDFTVKPTTSADTQDSGWWDIEDKDGNLVDMKPTREEAIKRAQVIRTYYVKPEEYVVDTPDGGRHWYVYADDAEISPTFKTEVEAKRWKNDRIMKSPEFKKTAEEAGKMPEGFKVEIPGADEKKGQQDLIKGKSFNLVEEAPKQAPPTLKEAVNEILPEVMKSDKALTTNEIIGLVRNFAKKYGLEFDSMKAREDIVMALGVKQTILKAPKGEPFKLDTEEAPVAEGPFKPEAAGTQDELFPGERAKYRAPEKGPPAPPPEGGLFAKGGGEEGFSPEKDFRKKPTEPVDEGKPMSRSAIAKFLSEKFDIPLRVGRFRKALGIFKVGPEVIRTRFANDIEVIAHEIGHALHKFLWPEARTSGGGLAAGPLRAFQEELIPIATKPRAGGSKNAEGYAEFIRRYIVDPDEAKRVAPKFYKFFEEELDKKSPDSKAILLEARRQYKAYFDQSGLKKLFSMISYGKDAKKDGVTTESLYRDVIDSFSELETVVKEMAGVKKIDDVPANLNPYKKMHLMAGWKGKADAWLEYRPYSAKTYKFLEGVKSFREIYEPIKNKVKEFDAFRVAKRAQHLGFEKTGVPNESVAEGLALEREHPEFTLAFKEIKKYRTALNRYLLDEGVIDFETYVRWKKGIDEGDYSSFAREMGYTSSSKGGTGEKFEVKGSPVKPFKGSWRDIQSPTESDIRDTYAFIHAAEKNAIGKALVDLSKQREGMGKFVEKIPADTQRIAVKDTELENMLRKYGKWTETTQFQTTERTIRESIKDETGADIPPDERGTKIVKERAVEALTARGYSKAEAEQIVGRIASAKNETARNRIIERVTERATVRNTVREFGIDIPEGLAYIYRKSPHTPRGNVITVMERGKPTYYEVDERIYNAFHALDKEGANTLIRILAIPSKLLRVGSTFTPEFSIGKNPIRDQWTAFINSKYGYIPGVDLAKGLFTAVKKNEDYWRWKIGGGEHSAMVSMDREYLDKTWTEIMRDRGIKAEALHIAQHPIDVLRALSEYPEEATRLGEMRKGLKTELAAGKNLKTASQDAAYASREVTLPFSRMGAKTKAVNMIVAFWNPNVQDLDKIHRQFKEYPLQTSIRTMAAITLPSVLLAIANHGNKKIDEIAQWQKDIFWLVDVGPFVMRIPKPFIMGILFGSFPERIVNNIMDKDPRAFDGLLDSLARGSSPGFLPTIATPIIENWANKSTFTDRPIVPKAREDVLPQYQYAPYTTETAKKVGGLMAKIPGIRGSNLEAQVVSPAKIENLIRGYTGGLGMWALHAANASLKTAGIVPARVEPSKQLADYPFMKAFVVRYPTADTESVQRFFNDYKEAETNLKSAKLLMKRGETTDASGILLKEEVTRLVGVKTALTNAHRLVDLVYENPNILPDEKRRMVDETYLNMTAIAREGNKILDKYKEAKRAAEK